MQLRTEELRALRDRQAAPADAEEDELSREFSGSVTLTFREDEEVTLTPEQARIRGWGRNPASCFAGRRESTELVISPCPCSRYPTGWQQVALESQHNRP